MTRAGICRPDLFVVAQFAAQQKALAQARHALETLTGDKISVGPPYFDLTFGPIILPLLHRITEHIHIDGFGFLDRIACSIEGIGASAPNHDAALMLARFIEQNIRQKHTLVGL